MASMMLGTIKSILPIIVMFTFTNQITANTQGTYINMYITEPAYDDLSIDL